MPSAMLTRHIFFAASFPDSKVIRITPLILAVALFMEQMDSTVIATSLPAIASDIGTSPVALKLAVTSYLVALAIFIPISGWMSDRFGEGERSAKCQSRSGQRHG